MFSCTEKATKNETFGSQTKSPKEEKAVSYLSEFVVDTLLEEPKSPGQGKFYLSPADTLLWLIGPCYCEKNMKDNSIKIQTSTIIPTKKTLDTLQDPVLITKKWLEFITLPSPMKPRVLEGQLKLVNIHLKDSLVKEINLISHSTANNNSSKNFRKVKIEKYKIRISRNKYSNASKVFGEYELVLPEEFGISTNDTILRGSFKCFNGGVRSEERIKDWNPNK